MGFRSFYFVYRHTVRNYGSALISRDRLRIIRIVFSSAARPDRNRSTWSVFVAPFRPVQVFLKIALSKLEANPSSRTRNFDFNQINLYCLTSHGGHQQGSVCCVRCVRTDPDFQSVFSQITGNEVSLISYRKSDINGKTRLIGNIIADQVQVQVQVFGITK
jgi:hypothetical protein